MCICLLPPQHRILQAGIHVTTKTKINNLPEEWAKSLNRPFSKEDTQMANKHSNRCSASLTIKEMQIKTTMRYHFTSIRIAGVFLKQNKYWWGYRETGTLVYCWRECKLVRLLWQFLKKWKLELLCDPELHFCVHTQKNWKQEYQQTFVHQCS